MRPNSSSYSIMGSSYAKLNINIEKNNKKTLRRAVAVWVPSVTRPHLHYRPHSTLMKLCENQTIQPDSRYVSARLSKKYNFVSAAHINQ